MQSYDKSAVRDNRSFMLLVAGIGLGFSSLAWAAPMVDGTRDVAYGSALAVQTVQTGFGDNASELNAGYAVIEGGRLYLMLTGNIESNFNRMEVFIDSRAGGQSVYASAGNDGTAAMNGLVFDNGFTADYHVIARRGNDGGNNRFDLDFADLGAASASGYFDFLGGSGQTGSGTTGTGVNGAPILVGYDDTNAAGVLGGSAAANALAAAAVSTGLELSIALSDLGYTGGPINIMVGINNQDHNYWSNQFLGGLPAPQGNLGSDEMGGFTGEGAIDMNHFVGGQFFRVVPEPASMVLLALGGVMLRRRR